MWTVVPLSSHVGEEPSQVEWIEGPIEIVYLSVGKSIEVTFGS